MARELTAEQRKESILKAALDVFAESGYHGGSIRAVAKKAGITEGLIYHYFKGKEDLYNSLVDYMISYRDRVLETFRPDLPLEENIKNLGNAFLKNIADNPDWKKFVRLIVSVAPTSDNERKLLFGQHVERGMTLMGQMIDMKVRTGELREVDGYMSARLFIGGMVAFFMLQYVMNIEQVHHVELQDFFDNAMDIFLHGIKKRETN